MTQELSPSKLRFPFPQPPATAGLAEIAPKARRAEPLAPLISAEELDAHLQFVASLGDKAIWRDYLAR